MANPFFQKTRGKIAFVRSKIKYIILGLIFIFIVDHFGLLSHFLEVDYHSGFSYPLQIRIDEAINAMKNKAKLPVPPINEYEYRFKIKNDKKCKQEKDNEFDKVVILYVVKSALLHQDRREAIRKSWGWENRFSDVIIRRIFIVGKNHDPTVQDLIDEEYARHKDIVQVDFFDSYYNNTIKTMMGFKWVMLNCPLAQFVMFSDDDMYVSTKNLLKFVRNPFNRQIGFRKRRSIDNSPTNSSINYVRNRRLTELDSSLSAFDGRLLAGYVFFSSPMRHKSSKWYITLAEYPYSKYPPYVTAGAYVMSYPALVDMYYASMFTKHFKFDDVYLGIVALKCGIAPLHNDNFYFWRKSYDKKSYADVIASHGFDDPEELKRLWEEQRSLGHA